MALLSLADTDCIVAARFGRIADTHSRIPSGGPISKLFAVRQGY
jgi:hypothetical protein